MTTFLVRLAGLFVLVFALNAAEGGHYWLSRGLVVAGALACMFASYIEGLRDAKPRRRT